MTFQPRICGKSSIFDKPRASRVPCNLLKNVVEGEMRDDVEVGPSDCHHSEGRAPSRSHTSPCDLLHSNCVPVESHRYSKNQGLPAYHVICLRTLLREK